MEVVIEILKGAGKLFIYPLTYLFLLVSFFVGLARVKRERKNFHVRVFDFILEAKYLFFPGIIIGLILSIITVLVGTYVTIGTLVFIALITFLLSGPWTFRWLSPAYVLGVTIFATLVIPNVGIGSGIVHTWSLELKDAHLPSLTFLLALLVVAEGYLIWKFGVKGTSPAIIKSKRGQEIGAHFSQKLWVVPVFLLVPGDAITSTFSWWPVLTVGQTSFSLFFVPFAIGFSQRIQSMLPSASISFTGKRVLFLGVGLVLVAFITLVVPLFSLVVAALGIVVRQWISTKQRVVDENSAPFFTKKLEGVIILGVIPGSPAEKMGLQVGELITKVNGVPVSEVAKFYEALQVNNRAFCKLEVLDYSGEVRFAQRALYDNEHHELGILFVHNYKQLTSEAV